jgi:hypothetical protein
MNQTLALLLDAYRELNAKRMFWVALAVSAVVVAAFGAVGIDGQTLTVFGWESPLKLVFLALISKPTFYKLLFFNLGVKWWLSWAAMILALASTAGIIPDFIAGGSIELYLSKPISRLRLLATKFLGGMIFVTAQVTVFSAASFLVLGLRSGAWEPSLFLAVPLVLLVFSYLFSVCVLLGLLTRSTVTALLLTLIFWFAIFAMHGTEVLLLRARDFDHRRMTRLDKEIASAEAALKAPLPPPTTRPNESPSNQSWLDRLLSSALVETHAQTATRLADLRRQRADLTDRFSEPYRIALAVESPFPKASETIDLLERELVSRADLPAIPEDASGPGPGPQFRGRGREDAAVNRDVEIQLQGRSLGWVLGTSCAFEAVVLALSAWVFIRRDF